MIKKWLVLLALCWCFSAEAQNITKFGVEGQYGFIIPHAADLQPFSGYRPVGLHLSWQKMKTTKEHWEVCNCFHYLGATFSMTDFGNRDVLGMAYTLSGTFEPILWQQERWSLSLNTGVGTTYLTQVYDESSNPENHFFSSPISFLLFVAPVLTYDISEKWSGRLSFNYNHISNGGQQKPNRGMNFPQVGVGVQYTAGRTPLPQYTEKPARKEWMYWLEAGATTRNEGGTNQKQPSLSLVAGAKRPVSAINALGAGIEVNRDYSLRNDAGKHGEMITAPFISHHFLLGRVDFSQRMALYLHQPEAFSDHRFYQRYVLAVDVGSGLLLGFSLKAHAHVATHLDLRIGWQF